MHTSNKKGAQGASAAAHAALGTGWTYNWSPTAPNISGVEGMPMARFHDTFLRLWYAWVGAPGPGTDENTLRSDYVSGAYQPDFVNALVGDRVFLYKEVSGVMTLQEIAYVDTVVSDSEITLDRNVTGLGSTGTVWNALIDAGMEVDDTTIDVFGLTVYTQRPGKPGLDSWFESGDRLAFQYTINLSTAAVSVQEQLLAIDTVPSAPVQTGFNRYRITLDDPIEYNLFGGALCLTIEPYDSQNPTHEYLKFVDLSLATGSSASDKILVMNEHGLEFYWSLATAAVFWRKIEDLIIWGGNNPTNLKYGFKGDLKMVGPNASHVENIDWVEDFRDAYYDLYSEYPRNWNAVGLHTYQTSDDAIEYLKRAVAKVKTWSEVDDGIWLTEFAYVRMLPSYRKASTLSGVTESNPATTTCTITVTDGVFEFCSVGDRIRNESLLYYMQSGSYVYTIEESEAVIQSIASNNQVQITVHANAVDLWESGHSVIVPAISRTQWQYDFEKLMFYLEGEPLITRYSWYKTWTARWLTVGGAPWTAGFLDVDLANWTQAGGYQSLTRSGEMYADVPTNKIRVPLAVAHEPTAVTTGPDKQVECNTGWEFDYDEIAWAEWNVIFPRGWDSQKAVARFFCIPLATETSKKARFAVELRRLEDGEDIQNCSGAEIETHNNSRYDVPSIANEVFVIERNFSHSDLQNFVDGDGLNVRFIRWDDSGEATPFTGSILLMGAEILFTEEV